MLLGTLDPVHSKLTIGAFRDVTVFPEIVLLIIDDSLADALMIPK